MGSKEFYPGDVLAVFDNLKLDAPKNHFTVGIVDDVTHTSLKKEKSLDITPKGTRSCLFWGLGSDGTVGANKSAIKIIGDKTDMYAQGYFAYDSKKSGGITISHLRFGHDPIHMPFLINFADYIAVHNPSYVRLYNVLNGIKEGGTFLLNCGWSGEELDTRLPGQLKRVIAEKKVNFYTIDAVKIAREIGLGGRINMIMQAAFFKLADIIPIDDAVAYLKESIEHTYGKKGQDVVDMNGRAVEAGVKNLVKVTVPEAWKDCTDEELYPKTGNAFVDQIMMPMNQQEGNTLSVGQLMDQPTVRSRQARQNMKNAALLSWYRNGRLNTASSATSARPSVRTRPSDRYSSRRKKWKNPTYRRNPPLVPRTFISALLCRPWTARAAATASTPARPRKRPSWPNRLIRSAIWLTLGTTSWKTSRQRKTP